MPYIPYEEKELFNKEIENLAKNIDTEGQLNFALTRLCFLYAKRRTENYALLNSIIGVLECAKQEYYRKIVSKYEDRKEELNGPVYE
jgi:hypothetical protein